MENFPTLVVTDICDSCPSRAVTSVLVDNDLPLLYFCGHHLRKYRAHIEEMGYAYLLNDEIRRDALFELPKSYAAVE